MYCVESDDSYRGNLLDVSIERSVVTTEATPSLHSEDDSRAEKSGIAKNLCDSGN